MAKTSVYKWRARYQEVKNETVRAQHDMREGFAKMKAIFLLKKMKANTRMKNSKFI
eukprot:TRINITY_DN1837_c0_g1_i1.p1 TRINITY_DN1837_c0_g1~~TRINITY_DN1837_c0_g1_i1.p1  ORF type:complete len:56 (-),score=7.45 TRINITY_DN1837_c0_g1_i1:279-446(-)